MDKYDLAQGQVKNALKRARKDGIDEAEFAEAIIVKAVEALIALRGEEATRAFIAFELANLDGRADLDLDAVE